MSDALEAVRGARAARLKHFFNSFSNAEQVSLDEDAVRKGEEIEENETEETTEKSDIMETISGYGDSKLKVSKTGKEIKEQVDSVLLPALNADLAAKKVEADNKLKECGAAPTKEPCRWWTGEVKMEVGYKIYDWEEYDWCPNCQNRMFSSLSAEDERAKKGNCAISEAEAMARREYNEIVRIICNISVDIKACEILKTLKDTSSYELTARQVLALQFA